MKDNKDFENALKEKYGKGVTDITEMKFSKPDDLKNSKQMNKMLTKVREIRKNKSAPDSSINSAWDKISKNIKVNKKQKEIIKEQKEQN